MKKNTIFTLVTLPILAIVAFALVFIYAKPKSNTTTNNQAEKNKDSSYPTYDIQLPENKQGENSKNDSGDNKPSLFYINEFTTPRQEDPTKTVATNEEIKIATDKYSIIYYPDENLYNISILQSPFQENKNLVEEALLRELGIDEPEACKLNISIGAPRFVDEKASTTNTGLSFCN